MLFSILALVISSIVIHPGLMICLFLCLLNHLLSPALAFKFVSSIARLKEHNLCPFCSLMDHQHLEEHSACSRFSRSRQILFAHLPELFKIIMLFVERIGT